MISYTTFESPIGPLLLVSDGSSLTGLHMEGVPEPGWLADPSAAPLPEATMQLEEYFAGERRRFDLPLAPEGTRFQRQVWDALLAIPYGETASYAQVAARVGTRSARAVGRANGANPIAIVVPCHRVIGADGSLTGFGGGLERKAKLLALENPSLFEG